MVFRISLSLFIFFSFVTYGQTDVQLITDKPKYSYDTIMIKDLSQKLSIWNYTISKVYDIKIKNENTKNEIRLSPNKQVNFGLGFNYKWMGLGIAFKPPLIANDDDKYGDTKRLDLQLNIFTRSIGVDASFQYYNGYYVSNPGAFTEWNEDYFPLLEDLKTASLELSGYYFSNHKKFSYRAAYIRNELQLKSAGSPIFGAYTRWDMATAPEGFIPDELPTYLKDTFLIDGYRTSNFGISSGYTYTFIIWKKFFLNLSLVPGFGVKRLVVTVGDEKEKDKIGASARLLMRSSIGYEHKYFYAGSSVISITNSFTYENINVANTTTKIRFFVGKRFNYPLKRPLNLARD